jgi:hypothetical protein
VRKAEIDCDAVAGKEDVKDSKGNDLFGVGIPSKAEIAELGTRPSWRLVNQGPTCREPQNHASAENTTTILVES